VHPPLKASFILFLVLVAAGAAYYFFVYAPKRRMAGEPAYVLADSLAVFDTPAEIRSVVATLKEGDRVEVLSHTRNWARVRLPQGRTGYVETRNLIDAETHAEGEKLLEATQRIPAQANGHGGNEVHLRLAPSRDATEIGHLDAGRSVEIFERRLVERPRAAEPTEAGTEIRDAWYLVGTGSKAGWVLGRLIDLDIPAAIAADAHDVNLVAWVVLNTADDAGRRVPQYLVADRAGTEECDFTHIRVLTWWKRKQAYAVAYVEGGLQGYFPIRASSLENAPVFRLRLMDDEGRKFQKVYELMDTITRPVGTVAGWESDAIPLPPPRAPRRGRRPAHPRRRPAVQGTFQ